MLFSKSFMTHPIQCQCGALRGQLNHPHLAIRGICYCKDCRAYANHLGSLSTTHDDDGGAEFVATLAKHVSFSKGIENLACLSLSENGSLRWYASCCNTPIGNTLRNWKVSYVGLVHTCLKTDSASFERTFPQLKMRVNTSSAKQPPPSLTFKTVSSLMGFVPRVFVNSFSGAYQQTPFFHAPEGTPVVPVMVLSQQEHDRAYELV